MPALPGKAPAAQTRVQYAFQGNFQIASELGKQKTLSK